MAQVINTNIASLNAQRNLNSSQNSLQISLQRLSSGLRVNSAKDDAAGIAIAERMTAQVRGMSVAIRNANDAISMAQTAEGALGQVANALERMRELAVQARNASNSNSDKDSLDQEFGELAKEIQRVLGGTAFNGKVILGAGAGTQIFQVGAGTATSDSITVTTTNLTADTNITDVAGTDNDGTGRAVIDNTADNTAIGVVINDIDLAIDTVNSERSTYGATQNRFEVVISNLQVSIENQTAARSRIMDADFAAETAAMTRNQILQQAGVAMLAQSNALPRQVLSLLGG